MANETNSFEIEASNADTLKVTLNDISGAFPINTDYWIRLSVVVDISGNLTVYSRPIDQQTNDLAENSLSNFGTIGGIIFNEAFLGRSVESTFNGRRRNVAL